MLEQIGKAEDGHQDQLTIWITWPVHGDETDLRPLWEWPRLRRMSCIWLSEPPWAGAPLQGSRSCGSGGAKARASAESVSPGPGVNPGQLPHGIWESLTWCLSSSSQTPVRVWGLPLGRNSWLGKEECYAEKPFRFCRMRREKAYCWII